MKRKKKNKKRLSLPAFLIGLLVIFGVGVTVLGNQAASTNFKISSLEKHVQELREENKQLETKATSLKSLDSLEQSNFTHKLFVPVNKLKHLIFSRSADDSSVSHK